MKNLWYVLAVRMTQSRKICFCTYIGPLWLETDNKGVGLAHIKERHFSDFVSKHGVSKENIVGHLDSIITTGKLEYSRITMRNGKPGYERLYNKNGQYYLLSATGTNGFLVTAYPLDEKVANNLIRRYKKWVKK